MTDPADGQPVTNPADFFPLEMNRADRLRAVAHEGAVRGYAYCPPDSVAWAHHAGKVHVRYGAIVPGADEERFVADRLVEALQGEGLHVERHERLLEVSVPAWNLPFGHLG